MRPLPCVLEGRYQVCRGRGAMFAHGYVPLSHAPGLWGGYADYMYLDPCSIVHKIRADIPASLAVMFNPLGAGFRWAVEIPSTGPGDTVLILGPGQRGLAVGDRRTRRRRGDDHRHRPHARRAEARARAKSSAPTT